LEKLGVSSVIRFFSLRSRSHMHGAFRLSQAVLRTVVGYHPSTASLAAVQQSLFCHLYCTSVGRLVLFHPSPLRSSADNKGSLYVIGSLEPSLVSLLLPDEAEKRALICNIRGSKKFGSALSTTLILSFQRPPQILLFVAPTTSYFSRASTPEQEAASEAEVLA
jgi:hypothetical protein